MNRFPRGRTALVSGATFGIGEAPGFESIEMMARASLEALSQAGLKPGDVDAVFANLPEDMYADHSLSEYFGIRPRYLGNNRPGGSAFETHVIAAALALDAGLCNVALIAYGSNQRSASGKLVSARKLFPYEGPYRPLNPISSYALAAARHMHQFGTTRRDLAEVAVAARQWANLNPEAFAKGPLSIEDCLNARLVSDPFSVRDCCLVTDGAAAAVMVRADRARDLARRPVYVLGGGMSTTHQNIVAMADLTTTAVKAAAEEAYAGAKLAAKDMDFVQLYDAFTINTVLFLEDMGFCAKGEGGRFVSGGNIAPGGNLPVNTNGGGLSCVHPGMYGLFTIVESIRQIQGSAGERQLKRAEAGVAHGNGGTLSNEAMVILGSAATL
jgi:acetyl-CoA acetyltransferase